MSQRFEISFMFHGELAQFQFLGETNLADEIRNALTSDLGPVDPMNKGDIQVYPVDCHPGSVSEIMDILDDNAEIDEECEATASRIQALRAMGDAIDEAAEQQDSQAWLLEFIWDVGGGDDNPFSQAFNVAQGQDAQAHAFIDALTEFLEGEGIAYEISCGPEQGKHDILPVAEAVNATIEVLKEQQVAAPRLTAIAQSYALEEDTPAAGAPRRRAGL